MPEIVLTPISELKAVKARLGMLVFLDFSAIDLEQA
jgi:hypothetical protein